MESILLRKSRKMNSTKVATAIATGAMTIASMSVAAFADTAGALDTVFNIGGSLANQIMTGLQTFGGICAGAAFAYFLVRMLLAGDAKDAAMYKKRCITTLFIVVILVVVPGLIRLAQSIGGTINGQL